MRFHLPLIVTVFLLLPFSRATAGEKTDSDVLPPEKTQIIYETLLPKEAEEAGESATENAAAQSALRAGTTPERMAQILRDHDIEPMGNAGRRQFIYEGMQMFLLADPQHNRMRLISPLARLDLLRREPDFNEVELLRKMLKANYLATGDVRLCVNNHIIWAAFLHPLDSLTERDFMSALGQLAETAQKTRGEID